MSEPDISTLARRLAEQNNVDWRGLLGSGPDGKVVERDVLDYLAKVMAGEEAVNPTPEPVPEGMEAWPEQDIQSLRAGVGEAATLGELRDEIGNASRDYLTDGGTSAGAHDAVTATGEGRATASGYASEADVSPAPSYAAAADAATGYDPQANQGTDTIDEDIFLFEDEHEPAAVDATYQPAAPAAAGDDQPMTDDLDDLLVAGDDFDTDGAMVAATDLVDTFATASDDARLGAVSGGYLGTDSVGDSVDAVEDDRDSVASDAGEQFTVEEVGASVDTFSTSTAWDGGARLGSGYGDLSGDLSGDLGVDRAGGEDVVPDLWGPAATAADDDTDLWTGADQVPDVGAADDSLEEAFTLTARADSFDDLTGASDVPASAGNYLDASAEPDTEFAAGSYDEPSSGPDAVATTGLDAGIGAGLAAVGATLLSAGSANLPLARPGTILRRNIDVSALAAAQLAVGQELGFDEPLSASVFLLRAVVKAAATTGFTTGAVGLAVLEESVTIRRVDGAAAMSFSDLVDAVASAVGEEDEPVLVAADLSGLDVDEAVLELAAPVISLGRIMYDNQRGAYRSTLSLSGPMPLDAAAALLTRVAELLDAPVRLVL